MTSYVVFLRGVNVGGKAIIKMADLTAALSGNQLNNVRSYIQSGNLLCESDLAAAVVESIITNGINDTFGLTVQVTVFSKTEWQQIVSNAPDYWGRDDTYKHNILIMIGTTKPTVVIQAIGELKPDIEYLTVGKRVLYQTISWEFFGRSAGGKLASKPIYKQLTVRNFNTAKKLLAILEADY